MWDMASEVFLTHTHNYRQRGLSFLQGGSPENLTTSEWSYREVMEDAGRSWKDLSTHWNTQSLPTEHQELRAVWKRVSHSVLQKGIKLIDTLTWFCGVSKTMREHRAADSGPQICGHLVLRYQHRRHEFKLNPRGPQSPVLWDHGLICHGPQPARFGGPRPDVDGPISGSSCYSVLSILRNGQEPIIVLPALNPQHSRLHLFGDPALSERALAASPAWSRNYLPGIIKGQHKPGLCWAQY